MKLVFSIVAFVMFSFISIGSKAQTTAGSQTMIYVELSQLTVDNFPSLFHKLKDNSAYELVESCVPAKVISVRLKNPQSNVAADFTNLKTILSTVGFSSAALLEGYGDADFVNRCQTARNRP